LDDNRKIEDTSKVEDESEGNRKLEDTCKVEDESKGKQQVRGHLEGGG